MIKTFELIANIVAVLGILVCAIAGLSRMTGNYYVLEYEAMTVFFAGIGMMVFAVLVKLELLLRRS